jgi:hypothetical protein
MSRRTRQWLSRMGIPGLPIKICGRQANGTLYDQAIRPEEATVVPSSWPELQGADYGRPLTVQDTLRGTN